MYKSIFQKPQKTIDYTNEVQKINEALFLKIPAAYRVLGNYVLYNELERTLQQWPYRGSALTLEEFLNNHDLQTIVALFKDDRVWKEVTQDEYLTFMDILLNLINFYCRNQLGGLIEMSSKVAKQIACCLAFFNYEPRYLPDGKVLLVETGANLSNLSAAEQPNLEECILQYRLRYTKGNIRRKRDILTKLANEYEPKLKHNQNLHEILPQFANKLRHAVNKMDIRHNNHEGKGQKTFLQTLPDNEYEQLLDDIYNCLLTLRWCVEAKPGFQRICDALTKLEEMEKQDKGFLPR